MNSEYIVKGRAEYEELEKQQLFEEEKPSSIFPWILESGYEKGMIIAKRGTGKTFYIRKLAEELPTKIYGLNKKTLNYELYKESDNPKLIVDDDLHYLLQKMRLGYLKDDHVIEEEKVLKMLKDTCREAKDADAKIVFIADDGPGGLSWNFNDIENKKEFLNLFDDCVATSDDSSVFYKYLGRLPQRKDNILIFRQYIEDRMITKIKKQFGMKDIPAIIPSNVNKTFVPEDKPEVFLDESGHKDSYSMVSTFGGLWGEKLIAPIRELKVLSDELGELNRKTLGLDSLKNFGEFRTFYFHNLDLEGWMYTFKEISSIEKIISKKYSEMIREKLYEDMLPLAKKLLSTSSENEFRAILVENEISKE